MSLTLKSPWPGRAAALVGGVLITLSLAPFGYWPLGILALALLHNLLDTIAIKRAFGVGWWFGAGLFLSGVSWVYVSIHDYGDAPLPLAGLLTLGFCLGQALLHGGFAYSYVRWLRDLPGGRWLGFAASWVLWEWLRSWLLTGFPWIYVGYAHVGTALAGWAPVAGVWGIGLIVAFSAAALASAYQHRSTPQRALAPVGIACLLWLAGWILQGTQWTHPQGVPVTVALVQANIPQSMKWDPKRYADTLTTYHDLSAPLWSEAQVVIWSEAAIPNYYDNARDFFEIEASAASQHASTLISGVPYREPASSANPDGSVYNSAVALGNGGGVYHKQHLVPFGEYVPLEQWLRGLIRFLDMPMSDFQAGPANQPPLRAGSITLAPLICYEIVYPDLVRKARADVLLTLSNDAWFGHSIGPLQHLQMAQMRALENGRQLIRATNNGVTALIDEHGTITARLPQFEVGVLTGSVQPLGGLTPFSRLGSRPTLLLCALLIARCVLVARFQKRSLHQTAP